MPESEPSGSSRRVGGGILVTVTPSGSGLPACLVCREHLGHVACPGGVRSAGPLAETFHLPPQDDGLVYLGHLLVISTRHVADFAGLQRDEAAAVGVEMARWSAALKEVGATRVYTATIGHGWDHLHVHLLPRWPGTPDEVPWHLVDEWPGARRVDFGGAAQFFHELALRAERI